MSAYRIHFADGTSVVIRLGDELKCFTESTIVRISPETPELNQFAGNLMQQQCQANAALGRGGKWGGK